MANGKILRKLIKAGASGNSDEFRLASKAVIEEERQKQHHLLANDLERILYGNQSKADLSFKKNHLPISPIDKDRELPLLDVRIAQRPLEEVILSKDKYSNLEDFLEEHRRVDILYSYGIKPSNKVLFYGPPGCGKTFTAEAIAFELDLPFAIVRLDALVSSLLGETAVNLRKIFDFIHENEMVVLFDEFDAIGKQRADFSEHGELRRVVNAVLQMIDLYQGKSIILAATNHEQILDQAIWRRFDDVMEFPLPDHDQILKILGLKLRGVRRQFELDDEKLSDLFSDYSGADIERIVRRAIKKMILRQNEFLTIKDLEYSISREVRNNNCNGSL